MAARPVPLTFPPPSQALEIRTFVDGSTDARDRYHYAVYARRDIAKGDVLLPAIPKASCLSARTASCAAELRAERLGGGLALNIAIMHERRLGDASRWAGYFAVLPKRGERTLPMFWSESELRHLRGTDLLIHVREDASAMADDFREHVEESLCVNHPKTFPPGAHTLQDYLEAASIAASRAFFIGDDCGEALVPWADMFNHRTDGEHVHVMGADGGFEGDEEDDEEDERDDEEDESEESEESEASEADEADDEEDEQDDEEDAAEEEAPEIRDPGPVTGALEIHACDFASRGEELFNTFGEQNNASLLHKYGFCELENARATVTLDHDLIRGVLGADAFDAAVADLGVDADEDVPFGYFEIAPDGTVEEELLCVLGHALRRSEEADALTTESEEVRAAMRAALERRLEAYGDEDEDDAPAAECGGCDGCATGCATRKTPEKADDEVSAPAGGGVVGAAAARTLRRDELDVLRRAMETYGVGDDAGAKRKRT